MGNTMGHRIISDFSKGILWETPWGKESFHILVKAYYGKQWIQDLI